MTLDSSEFENGASLPANFTCVGGGINPSLNISGTPPGTKELILTMEDPDAPAGTFTHWLLAAIKPETTKIDENSIPEGAVEGKTTLGKAGYVPPCPPSGEHHYVFKIYALDIETELKENFTKEELEFKISGHIIDQAVLVGLFQKA